MAPGCGHHGAGNPDEDGGGSDVANVIAPDASDAGVVDAESDVTATDAAPGDLAGDVSPDASVGSDTSSGSDASSVDVDDGGGADVCEDAGNCASPFTVFPIERLNPSDPPRLGQITVGPDGNLWFGDGRAIGRMTPTGASQEFAVPGDPLDLVRGPDGFVWFTDEVNYQVGRITTDGIATEFPPIPGLDGTPAGIVAGPDGNIWFAAFGDIVRMTTSGTVTKFHVPIANPPIPPYATWLAAGADGNLWFTEQVGKIGRITPAGVITEFSIPETQMTSISSLAFGIAAGSDGNLWFAEPDPNKIGRITPAGMLTEFSVPSADARPTDIAAGPDGNLWFVENNRNRVGRITPAGVFTEFDLPIPSKTVGAGIIGGPDGGVWFTEYADQLVGDTYPAWVVRLQP